MVARCVIVGSQGQRVKYSVEQRCGHVGVSTSHAHDSTELSMTARSEDNRTTVEHGTTKYHVKSKIPSCGGLQSSRGTRRSMPTGTVVCSMNLANDYYSIGYTIYSSIVHDCSMLLAASPS